MANEITTINTLTVSSGNVGSTRTLNKTDIAQSAAGLDFQLLQVTTGAISLSPVGITTEGHLWMRNLDSTNYVDWGIASNHIGRMQAGEAVSFRLKPGATLNLQANTATCEVELMLAES